MSIFYACHSSCSIAGSPHDSRNLLNDCLPGAPMLNTGIVNFSNNRTQLDYSRAFIGFLKDHLDLIVFSFQEIKPNIGLLLVFLWLISDQLGSINDSCQIICNSVF